MVEWQTFRYTAIVCSAALRQENSEARANPRERHRLASSASLSSLPTASAIPLASIGSNTWAPSPATSAREPPFEVTTGQPHDIASKIGRPNPSYREAVMNN